MKRVFVKVTAALGVLLTSFIPASYASDLVVPVGVVVQGSNVEVLVAPSSVIVVDVVTESVSFEPGIYARYAQKFLGVRAPLMAKNVTSITSAKISKQTEGERSLDRSLVRNYAMEDMLMDRCDKIQIDLTSADVLPVEEAAQNAANEIFRLRRLRKDLLSGDLGEGFYGGGLQAALNEIDAQEREYTQLFMGRKSTNTDRRSFSVSLASGAKRYIVCRLSQENGIVEDSDLSAEPVMLQITQSGSDKIVAPVGDDKSEIRKFRVADMTKCELFLGSKLLAQSTLSLFEFGYDLNYPIVKR